jgi:hypothetical protein
MGMRLKHALNGQFKNVEERGQNRTGQNRTGQDRTGQELKKSDAVERKHVKIFKE